MVNLGNKLLTMVSDEELIKYGLDNDVWYVSRYIFVELRG